jgi:hypothetical protein
VRYNVSTPSTGAMARESVGCGSVAVGGACVGGEATATAEGACETPCALATGGSADAMGVVEGAAEDPATVLAPHPKGSSAMHAMTKGTHACRARCPS